MKIKKKLILVSAIWGICLTGCDTSNVSTTYNFENSSMEQDEQKEYMTNVAKFVNEISRYDDEICSDEYFIYLDDTIESKWEENNIYINTGEADLKDTFFKLFLAVSGKDENAGEAYGLAMSIYEKCKIGTIEDIYSDEELGAYFSNVENLYLLDFTLPMLETNYFDEDTVEYVQDAAISFVTYCIEKYGAEESYQLCMDTSEEGRIKLVELKNEWLGEIGATKTYEEFGKVSFSYNTEREMDNYPYVIEDGGANWYFSSEDVKKEGYYSFIAEYIKTAPLAEIDFVEAREVLKDYIPSEVPAPDIFTDFCNEEENRGGIYNQKTDGIWIYYGWYQLHYTLLHEYVHYLTLGEDKAFSTTSVLIEGVTEEIAMFECTNHMEELYYEQAVVEGSYTFGKEIGALHLDTEKFDGEIYYYYRAKLFYELEPQTETYQSISYGIMAKPSMVYPGMLSYPAAGSLIKYLVEQYGRENAFASCGDVESLQALTGKTFQEIYEDWGAWNEQRYQELKIE